MSQSSLPSDSIKVVPGRSKLRVESSNPVPRGNPTVKPSKVKLISPEEAMKLSSGRVDQVAVSPPRPKRPRASRNQAAPCLERIHTRPPAFPKEGETPEKPQPVLSHRTPEPPKPVPGRSTSKSSRPVLVNPSAGFRKEIVCGLRAFSVTTPTVRRKTTPSLLQYKTVEPPSPRALQIRSKVKERAANATQVVQGTMVEVADTVTDHGSKELLTRPSISDEELSKLLLYRPAMHPTWKGRIMDSSLPPEFDCEFWATPASTISRKAHKLSMAMPALLKMRREQKGTQKPFSVKDKLRISVVSLFSEKQSNQSMHTHSFRLKGDHAHLFEAMSTRKAMLKVNINGTELLILSSKLLDNTSQFLINTQKKTEKFLWGFFLRTKNSLTSVPRTANQIDEDLDYRGVVDMDLDTEHPTPNVALKLISQSQSTISTSPEKVNEEVNLPPGFEKLWTPTLVKLNIQGTSNPQSDLSGSAGLVRYESGNWVFGYTRCHKSIPEVAAGLLAIYHGLKILWDCGFRSIRLETTSLEIIDALTKKSDLFLKRLSILGLCKDMILKEWECEIYHISKEENSCAEWLASRLQDQPQGLVFFEYPPQGLMDLLEKDRLAVYKLLQLSGTVTVSNKQVR